EARAVAGVVEAVAGPAVAVAESGFGGGCGIDPHEIEAHDVGVEGVRGREVTGRDRDVVDAHRCLRVAMESLRSGWFRHRSLHWMADSGDPAILVRDVVKDFGPRRVIEGLDFSVPRGQVCAMLGPNGAGKTTTIHMLLGLTLPTEGRIEILGHDIATDRSAALARTNFTASYVSLPWRMKVRELLRVFCHLYSVPDPDAAIEEVAELLGIEPQLDRLGQSLSTGQQTMGRL